MKKKINILGAVIACVVLSFTGCASGGVELENAGNFGQQVRIPAKDFEGRGIVFTENKYIISTTFGFSKLNGVPFTYQSLLKEAQKLGADAIINVVIDKRIETSTEGITTTVNEIWYGSALAIKYTTVLKGSSSTIVSGAGAATTQNSDIYYLNNIDEANTSGYTASSGSEKAKAKGNSGKKILGVFTKK